MPGRIPPFLQINESIFDLTSVPKFVDVQNLRDIYIPQFDRTMSNLSLQCLIVVNNTVEDGEETIFNVMYGKLK